MGTFLCSLSQLDDGIYARLSDRSTGEFCIRTGFGENTAEALSQALGLNDANFASDDDEIESCVAALRQRMLKIEVNGRAIHTRGLA